VDESFTQLLEPEKLSKLNFKDGRSKFLLPTIFQNSTTQNTRNSTKTNFEHARSRVNGVRQARTLTWLHCIDVRVNDEYLSERI